MTDAELDKIMEDVDETMNWFKRREEQALQDILKYFDRIHDKLFAYQLFFLAGYISLVAIPAISISAWWLLVPILCIARLIYIDYRMMQHNKKMSNITKLSKEEREKLENSISEINRFSLEVILQSILLTGLFLWFLICNL